MKRILFVILAAVVLAVSLTGCSGVSQEEYDALVAENAELQNDNDELNNKCDSLEKDNSELTDDIAELQSDNSALKNENQRLENNLDTATQLIYLWDIDTWMLGRPETAVYSRSNEQIHESISTESTFYLEDGILSGKLIVTIKDDLAPDQIAAFIKSHMDTIYASMEETISEQFSENLVVYRYDNGDVIMVYYHYYDNNEMAVKNFSEWRSPGTAIHNEYAKLVE